MDHVEVFYQIGGTVRIDRWKAPKITAQQFREGKTVITLYDKRGKIKRGIHYRRAERVVRTVGKPELS